MIFNNISLFLARKKKDSLININESQESIIQTTDSFVLVLKNIEGISEKPTSRKI